VARAIHAVAERVERMVAELTPGEKGIVGMG